jgi:hypothetical protein
MGIKTLGIVIWFELVSTKNIGKKEVNMGRRGVLPQEIVNSFFQEAVRATKAGDLSMAYEIYQRIIDGHIVATPSQVAEARDMMMEIKRQLGGLAPDNRRIDVDVNKDLHNINDIRDFDPLCPEDYETLKDSIKRYGIELPITVMENNASDGGGYVIIDGYSRVKIAKELGITIIEANVTGVRTSRKDVGMMKARGLRANFARRQLSGEQRWKYVEELERLDPFPGTESVAGATVSRAGGRGRKLPDSIRSLAKKMQMSPRQTGRIKQKMEGERLNVSDSTDVKKGWEIIPEFVGEYQSSLDQEKQRFAKEFSKHLHKHGHQETWPKPWKIRVRISREIIEGRSGVEHTYEEQVVPPEFEEEE